MWNIERKGRENLVLITWMNFKMYNLESQTTKLEPNLPSLLPPVEFLVANPKLNLSLKPLKGPPEKALKTHLK